MARGLTALKIENTRADPNRRKEIPDHGKPGLYLVIQSSGKKSWAVRYRRLSDKAPRKFTLEGFPSLGVARQLAQDVLDKVAAGEDPAAEKQIAKRVVLEQESDTFADVAVQFIKRDQRPTNRTWHETARVLGLKEAADKENLETIPGGLVDRWGNRKISEIKKREIIDLLDGIAEDAPVMANRTLAAIRRLFNWCLEKDRIQFSPCAGLKQGKEHHRTRVLSDDEIRLFWQACDELKFPYGSAAKLLLLTGARRSEVGEMTIEEIKEGVWTVPARAHEEQEGPHGAAVVGSDCPVEGCAVNQGRARPYLHAQRRVAFTAWHLVRDRLHELMVAKAPGTKIAPWRLHDLRRTMASGMARLGVKLEVIEKCLNHVSGSFAGVVGVYQLHSFEKEKREAFDKWGEEVERIVAGKRASEPRARRA